MSRPSQAAPPVDEAATASFQKQSSTLRMPTAVRHAPIATPSAAVRPAAAPPVRPPERDAAANRPPAARRVFGSAPWFAGAVAAAAALGVAIGAGAMRGERPAELVKRIDAALPTLLPIEARTPEPPAPAETTEAPEPAVAPAAASQATAASKSAAPRPARAKPPGAKRDEGCYTLDASGVWHVRPECL